MTSISVVVPTLGREDRLRRALASVRDQTHQPTDLAVVDGSPDRAAEPVLAEGDFDFKATYVHQTDTEGLAAARNLGIDATDGDLIAFLDDDDQWLPEKLERQVAVQDQTGHGLIFCGIKNVLPDGTVTNVRQPTEVPDAVTILTGNSIGTPSSVVVKRTAAEVVGGFDEDLATREEWDFYIRVLQETPAAVVPKPLVLKEHNPEGMSRNVSHSERDYLRVFEKHRPKYDDKREREFRANYHFVLGRQYAKSGKIDQARAHFRESFAHDPQLKPVFYYLSSCLGSSGYNLVRKFVQRLRLTTKQD